MTAGAQSEALSRLAAEIREASWNIALEYVEDGLAEGAIPSLGRLGRLGQLGDVPTFIVELAREIGDPQPGRLRAGSPLAALVRDHARERETLGFAPREIVTEFLLLRRVLWRFVSERVDSLGTEDVLLVQRRLNDTIDSLITECVVAYFDRATSELASRARRDPLTDLLNHHAFSEELALELDRAARYQHGLTLAFFDVDGFKRINDSLGHPVGDQVLRKTAAILRESLRGSDLAGRMGGDEFAALLLETDPTAGGLFLDRLDARIAQAGSDGSLPSGFSMSGGAAHYPTEGITADALLRLADSRLYDVKRARAAARGELYPA